MKKTNTVCLALFFGVLAVVWACNGGEESAENDAGAADEMECPEGSTLTDGEVCLFACPDGWTRNDEGDCMPACPEGWSRLNEICAPPCPDGLELVNGGPLCRPPEETVGPAVCAAATYDLEGSEPTDRVIHVDEKAGSGGDGSEGAPFETLEEAFGAIVDGDTAVSVALAPGEYDPALLNVAPDTLPDSLVTLRLLGACAEDTVLSVVSSLWRIDWDSGDLEVRRVSIVGTEMMVQGLNGLVVRDCVFRDSPTNGLNVIGLSGEEGLILLNSHLGARKDGLFLGSQVGTATVRGNWFRECGDDGVSITGEIAATVEGNWFTEIEGTALGAMLMGEGGSGESLRFSGNWFDEIGMNGVIVKNWLGEVEVEGSSFTQVGSGNVWVSFTSKLSLDDIRVEGGTGTGNMSNGLYVVDTETTEVEAMVVYGFAEPSLRFERCVEVAVSSSWVEGSIKEGVLSEKSGRVSIADSFLVGNDMGARFQGGQARLDGVAIAGSAHKGVAFTEVTGVVVEESYVVGSGSTGVELSVLREGGEDGFSLEGNTVQESKGVGIMVRSGGENEVDVRDNRVRGTRLGTVANVQAPQGAGVGDGIAILTGTDKVASTATVHGNTVGGNFRHGIIAHGEGTLARVVETRFEPANGFGEVDLGADARAEDLVLQDHADIKGGDVGVAVSLPGTDLAYGGGGDPK